MKDPALAALLSIVPGLGQIYAGRPRLGALIFLVLEGAWIAWLLLLLPAGALALKILWLSVWWVLWGANIIHAYNVAKKSAPATTQTGTSKILDRPAENAILVVFTATIFFYVWTWRQWLNMRDSTASRAPPVLFTVFFPLGNMITSLALMIAFVDWFEGVSTPTWIWAILGVGFVGLFGGVLAGAKTLNTIWRNRLGKSDEGQWLLEFAVSAIPGVGAYWLAVIAYRETRRLGDPKSTR